MLTALVAVTVSHVVALLLLAYVARSGAAERAVLLRELRHAHNLLATRSGAEAAAVERAQAAADTPAPVKTTEPGPEPAAPMWG